MENAQDTGTAYIDKQNPAPTLVSREDKDIAFATDNGHGVTGDPNEWDVSALGNLTDTIQEND